MKNEENFHKLTDLTTLVVFTLLAVCILGVLITGADVYSRLTEAGSAQFDSRTLCRYLSTRVHQADAAGQLSLEDFGSSRAIVIREELAGGSYLTRIYCHEGYLRELFTPENGTFSPEDGEKLLPAAALDPHWEEGLLVLELTLSDGTRRELFLDLRSEGGDLP